MKKLLAIFALAGLVFAAPVMANEGGVPLDAYANVRRWLARVEALPGFVPMVRSPVARAA